MKNIDNIFYQDDAKVHPEVEDTEDLKLKIFYFIIYHFWR
jgi:hypothetical protein